MTAPKTQQRNARINKPIPDDYRSHKVMLDGSHVPLTKDEAAAIWKAAEDDTIHMASGPHVSEALCLATQQEEQS